MQRKFSGARDDALHRIGFDREKGKLVFNEDKRAPAPSWEFQTGSGRGFEVTKPLVAFLFKRSYGSDLGLYRLSPSGI